MRPLSLYVLRFAEVGFLPLSSGVTNPIGRLGGSAGCAINSRSAKMKRPGFRVGQLVKVRRSRPDQRVVGDSLPRAQQAGHCPAGPSIDGV